METEEGPIEYVNKNDPKLEYKKTSEEIKEEGNRIVIVLTSLINNIFCISAFLYFGWSVHQKEENLMLKTAIIGFLACLLSIVISYCHKTGAKSLRDYFITGHYVWMITFLTLISICVVCLIT